MTPGFRDDPADPSARKLDAAGRAVLMNAATELHGRRCHGGALPCQIGRAIRRREHPAFPAAPGRMPALGGFSAAQHVRRHAGGLRKITPTGPARKLGFVVAEIK
jgi:hypothetical protein